MKFISFKADCLLLSVLVSLLWVVTDGTTTSPISTVTKVMVDSRASTSSPTTTPLVTTPKPKPPNPSQFVATGQTETSISLQWTSVEGISLYRLKYENNSKNVSKVNVSDTITGLTSGKRYNFTLFSVLDDVESDGISIIAVTAPTNAESFTHSDQNETSITLMWTTENGFNYTLEFNGTEKNFTHSETPTVHAISDLNSGTKNEFILFTVLDYARSSGKHITAVTVPTNAESFTHSDQNETSITLMWTTENDFNYTLGFNGTEKNFTHSKTPTVHAISDLNSGTKYKFILFTVLDYARSSGKHITAVTVPTNAESFTHSDQNETSITLMWTTENGFNYTLEFNGKEENFPHLETPTVHTISDLKSGTKYEFILFTVLDYARSSGKHITAVTVPSRVDSVSVTERTENSIRLEWTSANENWGHIVLVNDGVVTASSNSATVSDLHPGTAYNLSVITQFSGLNSTPAEVVTVTKINCAVVNWQVTNSTITGTVEGLFSSANAVIDEQTSGSVNGGISGENVSFTQLHPGANYNISLFYEIASKQHLQCSHSLTLIPPTLHPECKHRGGYSVRVFWEKVQGVWTSVEINIAGNDLTVQDNELELQIDQLQPAKTYKGSLVSVSGTRRSAVVDFYCSTDPAGVIAGSVIGVLCFILLVGLAAFILVKKPDLISRKKSLKAGSKQLSTKGENISVADFPDHFHQLSLDDNRGFGQEYEDLSAVGTEQTRKAALLAENKPKNRFTNVLPYDWCRVKLSTPGHSETLDYINASYMPGYKTNREYIATQGPLPGTVNDFWRMIWEHKVKCIAMVTNCVEGGRTKCERYWPENGNPNVYGEISVTVRSEKKDTNWTLREFTVKNMKTSEERTVKHFHFTAWPDHGVPESTDVLIQFRGLIRQHIDSEASITPTVVHCSAGVGRTGTLIGLDVLLQQLNKEKRVDVKYFVRKMRLNRPFMVQTESQYIFLHKCIMDSLTPNSNVDDDFDDNFYENVGAVYVNATALREISQAQGKHPN